MHPLKSFKQAIRVVVEYTSGAPAYNWGRKRSKEFNCAYKARRFYTIKLNIGAEPKLINLDK